VSGDAKDDAFTMPEGIDACALSDACDSLGMDLRVVTTLRRMSGTARVAGRVITVELGLHEGERSPHHLGTSAIDSAQAGDVLIVAHQGRDDCAGWGGNLSRAAHRKAIVATLVDGAVRDVDEASELGYTVFARSATCVTARGRAREVSWGRPVQFAGVSVNSGDFVVADSSAIVFVNAEVVRRVVDIAQQIVGKERMIAEAIDAGATSRDALGANYETMLESP
jgi:4-hydroxy-4-methyl-2-oxoglutarate aldolase